MPPVEVEFSDKPEWTQLTVIHMQGPLGLHAFILVLATLVWLAELCMAAVLESKNMVTEINHTELLQQL